MAKSKKDKGSSSQEKAEKKQELEALKPLLMTFGIVLLVGIGYAIYKGGELVRVLTGGKSDAELQIDHFSSSPLIAADVNGDGKLDLLGIYYADGKHYVGAFDGPSGKLVWRHGPVLQPRQEDPLVLPKGKLPSLALLNGKELRVIQLSDGKLVKTITPQLQGATMRSFCAPVEPGGPISVALNSGHRAAEINWETGKTELKSKRPVCTPTGVRGRYHHLPPTFSPERSDYAWLWTIQGATLGHLRSGKKPPFKFKLQSFAGEKAEGAPRWEVDLAGPSQVDADADAIAVGTFSKLEITLYDAKTGKKRWTSPVNGETLQRIKFVVLTEDKVYALVGHQNDNYLAVVNRADGKSIGFMGGG